MNDERTRVSEHALASVGHDMRWRPVTANRVLLWLIVDLIVDYLKAKIWLICNIPKETTTAAFYDLSQCRGGKLG